MPGPGAVRVKSSSKISAPKVLGKPPMGHSGIEKRKEGKKEEDWEVFKHKEHAEPVSERNVLFMASWIPAASRGEFPASERAAQEKAAKAQPLPSVAA